MDSNEWRDNVEGDAMLLTTEEASLLIQFLQEWHAIKDNSLQRNGLIHRFSQSAAKLCIRYAWDNSTTSSENTNASLRLEAGLLAIVHIVYGTDDFTTTVAHGLREWYELFYDELEDENNTFPSRQTSMQEFQWEVVCRRLVSGFFDKAREIILSHPVLEALESTIDSPERLQAQCMMSLIQLIETRPTSLLFANPEDTLAFEHVKPSALIRTYNNWFQQRWYPFHEILQKNRLALGFEFCGHIQTIANILAGHEDALRQYAEDDLAFFIAKLFHSVQWISRHLQLRLLFEQIVRKQGPPFSNWNPSLRSLLVEILYFDQEKLIRHVIEESSPFRLFIRIVLGLVFDAFFEDTFLNNNELLPTEDETPLYQRLAFQLCANLPNMKDILIVLLCFPGLQNDHIGNILNEIDVEKEGFASSSIEFLESEAFQREFEARIINAGWMSHLELFKGRAFFVEEQVGEAAYWCKRAGVSDEESEPLMEAQNLVKQILIHDYNNFIRALKIETLNAQELLGEGNKRQQFWTEIHSLLKDVANSVVQNVALTTKLKGFSMRNVMHSTDLYFLMYTMSHCLIRFPKDSDTFLDPSDHQQLQNTFQMILQNPHLSDELGQLVRIKVIYANYVFGSHLPGYLIFNKSFMKEVLDWIMENNVLSKLDSDGRVLNRIVFSIDKFLN